MKTVAILGSTGSIGENTLHIMRAYSRQFKVFLLSAYDNIEVLAKQAKEFRPKYVALAKNHVERFKQLGLKGIAVISLEDIDDLLAHPTIDHVVLAMRGAGALSPFMAAVRAGKCIAPANKEALVMAGDILMRQARKTGAKIIPIDSEQSAIFQCLEGQTEPLLRVWLTASGGALRGVDVKHFSSMTVAQILKHPRWRMGKKITVDSATLMNKGFEIIEAQRLFALKSDQIKVLVHPEAIIHSMVEFVDGSLLAQLAITDMRLPIQYALTYPKRLPSFLPALDLVTLKTLNFENPDLKKFPCLQLAMDVSKSGGILPCVLNAANEEVVDAFLQEKIRFTDIYDIVSSVTRAFSQVLRPTLKDIIQADQEARLKAQQRIGK